MQAARRVRRIGSEQAFDVVHVHGDFLEARAGSRVAQHLGVPAVLTIHGALSKRWLRYLKSSTTAITTIVCVGSGIREQLQKLGIPPERIRVLSSGVDVDRIVACALRRPPGVEEVSNCDVVLFAGSLDPVKGLGVLLDAMTRLDSTRPKARLVILGDGPDKRLIGARHRNVIWLGARERDDVYAWLHRASVLVLPSRPLAGKAEGLPTILLEALAAGTWVVASDTGSVLDVMRSDFGGIVPPDDSTLLAVALESVLDRGEPGAAMEQTMNSTARARDWDIVVSQVDEILRAAIAQHA